MKCKITIKNSLLQATIGNTTFDSVDDLKAALEKSLINERKAIPVQITYEKDGRTSKKLKMLQLKRVTGVTGNATTIEIRVPNLDKGTEINKLKGADKLSAGDYHVTIPDIVGDDRSSVPDMDTIMTIWLGNYLVPSTKEEFQVAMKSLKNIIKDFNNPGKDWLDESPKFVKSIIGDGGIYDLYKSHVGKDDEIETLISDILSKLGRYEPVAGKYEGYNTPEDKAIIAENKRLEFERIQEAKEPVHAGQIFKSYNVITNQDSDHNTREVGLQLLIKGVTEGIAKGQEFRIKLQPGSKDLSQPINFMKREVLKLADIENKTNLVGVVQMRVGEEWKNVFIKADKITTDSLLKDVELTTTESEAYSFKYQVGTENLSSPGLYFTYNGKDKEDIRSKVDTQEVSYHITGSGDSGVYVNMKDRGISLSKLYIENDPESPVKGIPFLGSDYVQLDTLKPTDELYGEIQSLLEGQYTEVEATRVVDYLNEIIGVGQFSYSGRQLEASSDLTKDIEITSRAIRFNPVKQGDVWKVTSTVNRKKEGNKFVTIHEKERKAETGFGTRVQMGILAARINVPAENGAVSMYSDRLYYKDGLKSKDWSKEDQEDFIASKIKTRRTNINGKAVLAEKYLITAKAPALVEKKVEIEETVEPIKTSVVSKPKKTLLATKEADLFDKLQTGLSDNSISLEDGLEWMKKVMPNAPVEIVDGLIEGVGRGSFNALSDLIKLSEQYADGKTVYHEVFHRAFAMLPSETREKLLNEGSKKFGIERGESKATVKYSTKQQDQINYTLKAVDILNSDKAKQVFEKGKKANWDLNKILTELAIPKDQKQLILDISIAEFYDDLSLNENLALNLALQYSYAIEIKTATKNLEAARIASREGLDYEDALLYSKSDETIPTKYYDNLTVPGGTNYTEQEISTPLITPSIKGHAEFATNNGIGWFRSDVQTDDYTGGFGENAYSNDPQTKTRRILELQSDLFQKGRDKKNLVPSGLMRDLYSIPKNEFKWKKADQGDYELAKENNENPGLSSDFAPIYLYNNKLYKIGLYNDVYTALEADLPDSYKEENVPNNFLQLLNKDATWVTFFVKSIIQDSVKEGYEKVLFPTGNTSIKIESSGSIKTIQEAKESSENSLASTGLFYENTVQNILNKQFGKENVTRITDEYGNEWFEISLDSPKVLEQTSNIKFQSPNIEYTGDLAIEEKMAEWSESMLGKDYVAKNWFEKLLQDIWNWIKDKIVNPSEIEKLFRDINQGRIQGKVNLSEEEKFQTIPNETSENYWKSLYEKNNISNKEELLTLNIPGVDNKFRPDTENVYHGTNQYEIDSEGFLILKPSSNFSDKTRSISFTQIPVVAQDYMIRKGGSTIIKIKNSVLENNYEIESSEEIALNVKEIFKVPKDSYEIITVPTLKDVVKKQYSKEIINRSEDLKRQAKTDIELLNKVYSSHIELDNYDEMREQGSFEGDNGELTPDWYLSEEAIEAKASDLAYSEIIGKINKQWIFETLSEELLSKFEEDGTLEIIRTGGDYTLDTEWYLQQLHTYGHSGDAHGSNLFEELMKVIGLSHHERTRMDYSVGSLTEESRKKQEEYEELLSLFSNFISNLFETNLQIYKNRQNPKNSLSAKSLEPTFKVPISHLDMVASQILWDAGEFTRFVTGKLDTNAFVKVVLESDEVNPEFKNHFDYVKNEWFKGSNLFKLSEAKDDSDPDNASLDTKVGDDVKTGFEERTVQDKSSLELAGKFARVFFRTIPAVETKNGKVVMGEDYYQYKRDKDGNIIPADYTALWNTVSDMVVGALTINEIISKLENGFKKLPEVYIVIDRLKELIPKNEDGSEGTPKIDNLMVLKSIEKSFAKMLVPTLLVLGNEKDGEFSYNVVSSGRLDGLNIANAVNTWFRKYANDKGLVEGGVLNHEAFYDLLLRRVGDLNWTDIESFWNEIGLVFPDMDERQERKVQSVVTSFTRAMLDKFKSLNGNEIKLTPDLFDIVKTTHQIRKFTSFGNRSAALRFQDTLAEVLPYATSNMTKNAEGENQSNLHNFSSWLLYIKYMNEGLHSKVARLKNPIAKFSLGLKASKAGKQILPVNISGTINQTKEDSSGTTSIAMNTLDYVRQEFHTLFLEGVKENIRAETASSSFGFKIEYENGKYLPIGMENVRERMVDTYWGYFQGEIERIFLERKQPKEYGARFYNANKGGFTFFSGIIGKEGQDKLIELIDKMENVSEIKDLFTPAYKASLGKYLNAYFDNEVKEFKQWLLEEGGVQVDDQHPIFKTAQMKELIKNYGVDKLIDAFMVNGITMAWEEVIMFHGEIGHFDKFYKRSKSSISNGTPMVISDMTQRFLDETKDKSSFSALDGFTPNYLVDASKMTSMILAEDKMVMDPSQEENWRPILEASIKATGDFFGKTPNVQKQVDKIISGYKDKPADVSDGDGYIHPDAYRVFCIGVDSWSFEKEMGFRYLIFKEKIAKGVILSKEEQAFVDMVNKKIEKEGYFFQFPKLKFQYRGNATKNETNVAVELLDKFALAPLFPEFVKGKPKAEALLKQMTKEGVAYGKFPSGTKIGTYGADSLVDLIENVKKGDYKLQSLHEIESVYLKEQVKTPDKIKDKGIFGSQPRKLMISNLSFNGIVIPQVQEAKELWQTSQADLAEYEKKKLITDLGGDSESDNPNIDLEILVDMIREELSTRDVPESYSYLFEDFQESDLMEMSLSPQIVQTIIYSLLKNRIVKVKYPGGQFVQVSSALMDTGNERDLKNYREENGVILPADCKITLSGDFLNLLNLKEVKEKGGTREALNELLLDQEFRNKYKKELTIFAYRIPNQGYNSNDILMVQEFLPEYMGNTIVTNPQIVVKSGTDYDYDKMNVVSPSLGKDGRYMDSKDVLNDFVGQEKLIKERVNAIKEELSELFEAKDNITKDMLSKIKSFKDMKFESLAKIKEEVKNTVSEIDSEIDFLNGEIWEAQDSIKSLTELQDSEESQELFHYFGFYPDKKQIDDEVETLNNMLKGYFNRLKPLRENKRRIKDDLKTVVTETLLDLGVEPSELSVDWDDKQVRSKIFSKSNFPKGRATEIRTVLEDMISFSFDIQEAYLPKIEELKRLRITLKYKKTKYNETIEAAQGILLNPVNFHRLITPNSTDEIVEALDKVLVELYDLKPVNGKYPKVNPDPTLTRVMSMVQSYKKWDAVKCKDLLGIGAVANTFYTLMQNANFQFKEEEGVSQMIINKVPFFFKVPLLSKEDQQKVNISDAFVISQEVIDKLEYINQFINLTVDAASNDIAGYTNMKIDNTGFILFQVMLGVPFEQILRFIHQPIIYKYHQIINVELAGGASRADAQKTAYEKLLGIELTTINKGGYVQPKSSEKIWQEIRQIGYPDEIQLKKLVPKSKISEVTEFTKEDKEYLVYYLVGLEQASALREVQGFNSFDTGTAPNYKLSQHNENPKKIEKRGLFSMESVFDIHNKSVISHLNVHKEFGILTNAAFPIKDLHTWVERVAALSQEVYSDPEKFIRVLDNDFLLFIVQNFSNYDSKRPYYIAQLENGKLMNRWADLVSENPELKDTNLFKKLVEDPSKTSNLVNPMFFMGMDNSSDDFNLIINELRDMLKNPKTEAWTKDFLEIGFFQSGYNQSKHYMLKGFPPEFIQAMVGPAFHKFNELSRNQKSEECKRFFNKFLENRVLEFGKFFRSYYGDFNALDKAKESFNMDTYRMMNYLTPRGVDTRQYNSEIQNFTMSLQDYVENIYPNWIRGKDNQMNLVAEFNASLVFDFMESSLEERISFAKEAQSLLNEGMRGKNPFEGVTFESQVPNLLYNIISGKLAEMGISEKDMFDEILNKKVLYNPRSKESSQEFTEFEEVPNQTDDIYSKLEPNSPNVVITPFGKDSGREEIIKQQGGIDVLYDWRQSNKNTHFGNPFTSVQSIFDKHPNELIKTNSTKESVEKYIDWVINSKDNRAEWIKEQLKSGKLKGVKLHYANTSASKSLEPSHANALDWLINSPESPFNSQTDVVTTSIEEEYPDVPFKDLSKEDLNALNEKLKNSKDKLTIIGSKVFSGDWLKSEITDFELVLRSYTTYNSELGRIVFTEYIPTVLFTFSDNEKSYTGEYSFANSNYRFENSFYTEYEKLVKEFYVAIKSEQPTINTPKKIDDFLSVSETIQSKTDSAQDDYLYYGTWYKITVEGGKGVDVVGYKGKTTAKNKLLEAYNTNPNIDVQSGKSFRTTQAVTTNDSRVLLFTKDGKDYYLNEDQEKAYHGIKSFLKSRLKSTGIQEEGSTEFESPLAKEYSGIIPKAMWNNMIGLVGKGGVGKTSTVGKIIEDTIQEMRKEKIWISDESILYAAPTHNAVTMLQEALDINSEGTDGVKTLDSMIQKNQKPGSENAKKGKADDVVWLLSDEKYTEMLEKGFIQPLIYKKIIVIDESSMVGKEFFNNLMDRIKLEQEFYKTDTLPLFIFMGDYRQLPPVESDKQRSSFSEGIISATLFSDTSKFYELSKVMRSKSLFFHGIFNSIGDQISQQRIDFNEGKAIKPFDNTEYDRLTSESTNDLLVVNESEVDSVIEDYVNILSGQDNPYEIFWVHYNAVANPVTISMAEKIRKAYFQKLGTPYTSDITVGDYIEYKGNFPMFTEIDKDLNIDKGTIKPRARVKVLEVYPENTVLGPELSKHFGQLTVNTMVYKIFNRQGKERIIRIYEKGTFEIGSYDNSTKQISLSIKDSFGKIHTKGVNYRAYKESLQNIFANNSRSLDELFVPSYIGSSHTVQGAGYGKVIVGDYNIRMNGPKIALRDMESSWYVSLTRAVSKLAIIKPNGIPVKNNRFVFSWNDVKVSDSVSPITEEKEIDQCSPGASDNHEIPF